ncbi:DUF5691 domain-containing protein [Burkholderia ubonensis]|uniref:DUF5691 domain-containing protein n=1 Tax=Burkholderia ubonensis TaxID=101571 RepID=UPI000BA50B5F|nr:DUF5691 domain-containing protein [Burkholderia ubonensis]PAK16030.1 hypothetical protein CJO66_04025 [Burkholderia ubonensis]RQP38884.1 hypothetical protein DF155_07730 [Burkholderia ubonensis]RQP39189.1 hypothetical protein DF154_15505 [Burkholderia ubonensis]RQP44681.1 hypothetical protein DF156_07385 [Burkholderia ubonensis]RQP58303.1 hypothetical protein DF144_07435 [Burkholderia ubonensis]
MQALVRTALIGTANVSADVSTIAEIDGQLPAAASPERRLLLQAGCMAVYGAAGRVPVSATAQPAAEPDPVPETPVTLMPILTSAIAGELGGLAEWLVARMTRANRRLPHALLPSVFARPARFDVWWPVIGRRGHWLASQHPEWQALLTARQAPADDDATLLQAWDEGDMAARVRALTALRCRDAAHARDLLMAVLPKEKAEQRQAFVAVLQHGLSPADEPMLESLLDDRSQAVRQSAAELLLRLPESALVKRMEARADACLRWQPAGAASGAVSRLVAMLGKRAEPVLQLEVPAELPKDWERDGIAAKPPPGEGQRAFWLRQLVAAIAPARWSASAAATPDDALNVMAAHEWADALLAGCAAAACRHGDADWAEPLLRRALADANVLHPYQEPLWQVVRADARVELACRQLTLGNLYVARRGLASMPAPWSNAVAGAIANAAPGAWRAQREAGTPRLHDDVADLIELALLRVQDADLAVLEPVVDVYAASLSAAPADAMFNLDRARGIVALAHARRTFIKEMPL